MDDKGDALVRAFASDDDAVVVAADEGAVVDNGEDNIGDGASCLSGSGSGDEVGAMSD